MINIAFVGNPNVGKTAIINKISKATLKTGNWPGVTIEKKEVFFNLDGEEVKLVDLPGVYSLSNTTTEEKVSRDFLLNENVDVIINVLDSTSLEKNMYLTMLLKELGKPIITALNFLDEFEKFGYKLDKEKFEHQLGIEAVFTSGRTGAGIKELMTKAIEVKKEYDKTKQLSYNLIFEKNIEDKVEEIKKEISNDDKYKKILDKYPINWASIKILENDKGFIDEVNKDLNIDISQIGEKQRNELNQESDLEPYEVLARSRYGILRGIISTNLTRGEIDKFKKTDMVDKILLNKFFGVAIFIAMMYAMFAIVFNASDPFIGWVDGFFSDYIIKWVGKLIEGVPAWLNSFILEGVLQSIGAILTFVPLMMILYMFMSILEESGYMARVAFIMNKVMTKVGLSGKAFIPMLMGFGCTVPAIYSTRTLEDERTRRLTGVITTFMSCGARMPVYSMLAVAFFSKNAAKVVMSIYLVGILFALLTALVLKNFEYFKGDNSELLIELPPYRAPSVKVVWNTMLSKTKSYVKRASTVILGILLIVWFLSYFPNQGDVESSYLGTVSKKIQPIFKPTGFADRWEPVASLVPSVVAKEAVVGFLGSILITDAEEEETEEEETTFLGDTVDQIKGLVIAGKESVQSIFGMFKFKITPLEMTDEDTINEDAGGNIISSMRALWNDEYGGIRAYSFMLFVLLLVPCAVALGALKQEFGTKLVLFEIAFLLILPYVVSTLFFNIAKLFV